MEGCGQGTLSTMKSSCVREIVLLRETLVVMCSTDYKKSQLAKKKRKLPKKNIKYKKKSIANHKSEKERKNKSSKIRKLK